MAGGGGRIDVCDWDGEETGWLFDTGLYWTRVSRTDFQIKKGVRSAAHKRREAWRFRLRLLMVMPQGFLLLR
ncbi:hypothetical protein E2C01_032573 [Portunus trituberculatus]|uniref:Uncharacterized protein n=1 Tax=Portunus trituberculatus TaxID=210409 RepID=A0A5B7F360_PORTR|nr:hypothetical protein [Portunus trituberculatus]